MSTHYPRDEPARTGSLTIVGTGIYAPAHATLGARRAIRRATRVLFAVTDVAAARWLRKLNPSATALEYDTTLPRRRMVYERMVACILDELRRGEDVCTTEKGIQSDRGRVSCDKRTPSGIMRSLRDRASGFVHQRGRIHGAAHVFGQPLFDYLVDREDATCRRRRALTELEAAAMSPMACNSYPDT